MAADIEPLRKRTRYNPLARRPVSDSMDSDAPADLLVVLLDWAAWLQNIAAGKFIDHGTGPVAAGGPDSANPAHIRKIERPKSTPEDLRVETGSKKINQKPGATRAKFSRISGPDIYCDGESQKCLFDCWTSLTSKRCLLRKEMTAIRRNVMHLPTAYNDLDDDLEADDSDKEDTEEDRLQREEEERQRILEEQKREEDEKKSKRLTFIDGCLDKAARACENAAYLWLKGEGCMGHVVFITERMVEAVQRIQTKIAQNLKSSGGAQGDSNGGPAGAGRSGATRRNNNTSADGSHTKLGDSDNTSVDGSHTKLGDSENTSADGSHTKLGDSNNTSADGLYHKPAAAQERGRDERHKSTAG